MAIDSNDFIYTVGYSSEGIQNNNITILKRNDSLALVSTFSFNGDMNGNDSARTIAIDKNNNIFVAGHINWIDSLWIGKFDSSLVLQASAMVKEETPPWSPYNIAKDIGVDNDGNIWVAGEIGLKGWLGKYDNFLTLQSSFTITEGLGVLNGWDDCARILAIDAHNENVWVSGYSHDADGNFWGWRDKYNFSLSSSSHIIFECCGRKNSVDADGNLWEKSGETLVKYDSLLNIISSITLTGLQNFYVKSSTEIYVKGDITGNTWVAKLKDGYPAYPSILIGNSNISSITWNWNTTQGTMGYYNDATSYYVIDENSQSVSPVLSSSTLSWTEIGLSTNTAYTRAVVAANQFGVSTSSFLTKYTSASPPDNLVMDEVFITSATLSWSANDNPAYTRYEILQSTDNFETNISTPVPLSAGLLSLTTDLYNLSGGTTYYFKARAYSNEDTPTEFSNIASTITLPYPIPDNPIIDETYTQAISTNAINWSWTYNSTQPIEGFRLISSTGGYISAELLPSTTFFIQNELLPNTSSTIQVKAYYLIKTSTSDFKTIHTLANPPITSIDEIYQSSVTINWSANANSAMTVYEIYRSSDEVNFELAANTTNLYITDINLLENASYYYKARSINGDNIMSDFDITKIAFVPYIPPMPPTGFMAISDQANKVTLSWEASPTVEVTQYNVYTDSGTGIIDYSIPIMTVSANTLSLYISGISSGTYYYAIRAQKYTREEKNTNLKASVNVIPGEPFPLWAQAKISAPKAGKKIWGNRLNVFGELIKGSPSYTKEIAFQYRASTTGVWVNIPAVYYNNPDPKPPYYLHWDVTGLAKQEYEIRAQAVNTNNQSDPYAPSLFITVDNNNPDINANISGNAISHSEKIYGNANNIITVGALDQNHYLEITAPPNTVADTVINIISPPAIVPNAPRNLSETGLFYEINLESGQTALNKKATLKSNYIDDDNNGLIDGTLARADRLSFIHYNQLAGRWEKEFVTAINTSDKTITMETNHFSIYGIFSPAAANLNSVRIYPVPFKPNDGADDTGKPYNPADLSSGIIFDNLTQAARIEIYTVTGQLVWKKTTNDTSGKLQWDAKNNDGKETASGGYIALIIDTVTGQKAVKKIAIIR